MRLANVGFAAIVSLVVASILTGCSYVNSAVQTVEAKFHSGPQIHADPNDACTFLTGDDIIEVTGDKVLSKTQIPRAASSDSSSDTSQSAPTPTYDCSYNLAYTTGGYQQGNMEVTVIPTSTFDSDLDRGTYSQTSVGTGKLTNGNVSAFSNNHDSALWDDAASTLYEKRGNYALGVTIPFAHKVYDVQDSDKEIVSRIFARLPQN